MSVSWPLLDKQLDEIWVIARRRDRLEALRAHCRVPLRVLPLDLTAPGAADTLEAALKAAAPEVSILINAAGFGRMGDWQAVGRRESAAMIRLNCQAAVEVTQVCLPFMGRGSRVLEICSTSAFQPLPYLNVYAATKAFLYRYSRALHWELRPRGITVTAVCPYWIRDTEFIPTAARAASRCTTIPWPPPPVGWPSGPSTTAGMERPSPPRGRSAPSTGWQASACLPTP